MAATVGTGSRVRRSSTIPVEVRFLLGQEMRVPGTIASSAVGSAWNISTACCRVIKSSSANMMAETHAAETPGGVPMTTHCVRSRLIRG